MSNDLTDIPNVGPSRAETLRDAGYETKADVEDASKEELAEVNGIGATTAAAIDAGEISHQHAPEESQLPEKREALLEAASIPQTKTDVAKAAGMTRRGLNKYLNQNEEFAEEFRQRRAKASGELIRRGLEDDPSVDIQFAKFRLERSFGYNKTENLNVDADNTHRLEGDGFTVNFGGGDG